MSALGVIACGAVRERPWSDLEGSFKGRCFDCDCEVWISPSTRRFLVKGWRAVCIACLPTPTSSDTEFPKTSEMRADMEACRRAFADRHGVDVDQVTASMHPGLVWTEELGRTPLFKAPV